MQTGGMKSVPIALVFGVMSGLALQACSDEPAATTEPAPDGGDEGGATDAGRDAGATPIADAGADATPDVDAKRIELTLAPRAEARLPLARVTSAPPDQVAVVEGQMLARIEAEALIIEALRGAKGGRVEVSSPAGLTRVEVTAPPRPWAFLDGVVYEVETIPDLATSRTPDDDGTEAWAMDGARVFGTTHVDGKRRAFSWTAPGAPTPLPLPDGAEAMIAHHLSDGALFGAVVASASPSAARIDPAGAAVLLGWPAPVALFDGAGSTSVGASFVESVPHAILCTGPDAASCTSVEPATATSSEARAVDPSGRVVGCAEVDGVRRAFEKTGAGAVLLDAPARGCLSGILPNGAAVGEILDERDEISGYVASSPAARVRVPRSWGTRLFGGGANGALVGSTKADDGFWRGAVLRVVTPPEGVALGPAVERTDPELAHACGHTELGPFAAATAAVDPAGADTIVRTHTNYAVTMPGTARVASLRLDNTRQGKASLHLDALVPVRLFGPDGARIPTAFADDTSLCHGLRGFVELPLPAIGTYVIEIGPTERRELHVVYERSWAIEP